MHRIHKILLLSLIIVVNITSLSGATEQYILVEVPELINGITIIGDVLDIGTDQIIVGRGNQVDIYDHDQLVTSITGFSGNVTALALGDLTGNYSPELVIGTDNASFYVYQLQEDYWIELNEHRYLWAPINQIEIADITGSGWGDVVVRNARGEVYIFLSREGILENSWRSQPNEQIKFLLTADFNEDGMDEVVLTRNSGYVGVLRWQDQELVRVWENYPWGSIENLTVGNPISNHLPELMLTTSQKMFYSWQWNGTTFVSRRSYSQNAGGPTLRYENDFGLLSFSVNEGITAYTVGSANFVEQWRIPVTNIVHAEAVNDRILAQDVAGKYHWLWQINLADVSTYVNDSMVKSPRLQIDQGEIFVSLVDVTKLLGWTKLGTSKIFIMKGFDYIVLYPDTQVISWNNLTLPQKTLMIDDEVYVTYDLFSFLGYRVDFDYSTLNLTFMQDWGWW